MGIEDATLMTEEDQEETTKEELRLTGDLLTVVHLDHLEGEEEEEVMVIPDTESWILDD